MNAILKDLAYLGPSEKFQLVEDLWDSIDQDAIPAISDATHEEFVRRAAWTDAHPGTEVSVEQVAAKLGLRLARRWRSARETQRADEP